MNRTIAKIIAGKRYNTATAKLICSSSSSEDNGDFRFEKTALFKTPRGRFFLAGYGGALSRWHTGGVNCQVSGEGLEPITEGEARSFAKAHADAETFTNFFGIEEV